MKTEKRWRASTIAKSFIALWLMTVLTATHPFRSAPSQVPSLCHRRARLKSIFTLKPHVSRGLVRPLRTLFLTPSKSISRNINVFCTLFKKLSLVLKDSYFLTIYNWIQYWFVISTYLFFALAVAQLLFIFIN